MSIEALRNEILGYGTYDPAYYRKQIHPIPEAKVVDRVKFILERCKGKTVLHLGSDGPLHPAIEKVAAKAYGVDLTNVHGAKHWIKVDLDTLYKVPLEIPQDVDLVLCAEVLEHLRSPGFLLENLKGAIREIIITAPNAYSEVGFRFVQQEGTENVNIDHTMHFSYRTMKTLLEKCGYKIKEFYWYNGKPMLAEGMIIVC